MQPKSFRNKPDKRQFVIRKSTAVESRLNMRPAQVAIVVCKDHVVVVIQLIRHVTISVSRLLKVHVHLVDILTHKSKKRNTQQ